MKKLIILACGVASAALAAVYQGGASRNMEWPDLKIVLCHDGDDWKVVEDSPLFAARFASIHPCEDMLNRAETRELAKSVAVAIARHLGSTNSVRVVHFEAPTPATTNIMDVLVAHLNGKYVTDEIVPLN